MWGKVTRDKAGNYCFEVSSFRGEVITKDGESVVKLPSQGFLWLFLEALYNIPKTDLVNDEGLEPGGLWRTVQLLLLFLKEIYKLAQKGLDPERGDFSLHRFPEDCRELIEKAGEIQLSDSTRERCNGGTIK